jgi:hypothetical protein
MSDGGFIEALERNRLRLLVAGDVAAVRDLHAVDFQLITPSGEALSRDEYLGLISSGRLSYRSWEPADVVVRDYGDAAVLRYRAALEGSFGGESLPPMRLWHTDLYERRDGRWQVVWSQATAIG